MSDRADELKEILAAARKEHAFGLALGGKGEPVVLTSNTKSPEALQLAAKAQAGGKVGAGTLAFDGGRLVLKFTEDPPVGCLRALKGLFRAHKVKAKIALMLPDGSFEEDGEEDVAEEGGGGQDATAPQDAADPDLVRLKEVFARTEPMLRGAAQADPSRAAQIGKLITTFHTLTAATPPDITTLTRLVQAAQQALPKPARPLSQPAPSPEAAALQETMRGVVAQAVEAAKANPALVPDLKFQTAVFQTAMGQQPPDLAAAKAAMAAVQKLLPKPARPLSQPQAAQAAPKPAAPDLGALQQTMSRIAAQAREAAAADPGLVPKVLEVARQFSAALATVPPDTDGARKAMMAMQALVPKPAAMVANVEVGKAIAAARDKWKRGIASAAADLGRLEQTIAGSAAGMPGVGRIAKPFDDLRSVLTKMQAAMIDALSAENDLAARKAIVLRERLTGVVNGHPVLSRIDGNPFFATSVTRTLHNALYEVGQTLEGVAMVRA